MGHVRLLVCFRHLIKGRGQVRALAGAGLASRRVCDNYLSLFVFISEVAWKKDYLRKLLVFGFVATMRLLSNYFDLLLSLSWVLNIWCKIWLITFVLAFLCTNTKDKHKMRTISVWKHVSGNCR